MINIVPTGANCPGCHNERMPDQWEADICGSCGYEIGRLPNPSAAPAVPNPQPTQAPTIQTQQIRVPVKPNSYFVSFENNEVEKTLSEIVELLNDVRINSSTGVRRRKNSKKKPLNDIPELAELFYLTPEGRAKRLKEIQPEPEEESSTAQPIPVQTDPAVLQKMQQLEEQNRQVLQQLAEINRRPAQLAQPAQQAQRDTTWYQCPTKKLGFIHCKGKVQIGKYCTKCGELFI